MEYIVGNILLVCLLLYLGYCFLRIDRVIRYRKRLEARIVDLSEAGLRARNYTRYEERCVAYNKVSIEMMVFKPWVPLDSWFEGEDFNLDAHEAAGWQDDD